MNIIDVIKKRRSIRTFKKEELSMEDLNKVKELLNKQF